MENEIADMDRVYELVYEMLEAGRRPREIRDTVTAAIDQHRLIQRGVVQHLDGDPRNNDPSNLRIAHPEENKKP